jgi:hypothetical protein
LSYDPLAVDVPKLLAELGVEATHDGDTWLATCPGGRHADRRPSWRIKDVPGQEKHGVHYCHSCKWGGTAIDLVVRIYGFSGPGEAVSWIEQNAMGAGQRVERLIVNVQPAVAPRFRLPATVLVLPLASWAPTPRRYLVEQRGFDERDVEQWGLGYAVEGRLQGRIVFPARDERGRIGNYTARTFVGAMVRYLSASEEEGPDHSCMFGEHLWPDRAARRGQTVVATEGALNAMAARRATGLPVAALSGSKVNLGQILKLAQFGRVLALTDPDLAGEAAADRMRAALIRHVEFGRVELPKGSDPATVAPSYLGELIRSCGPT